MTTVTDKSMTDDIENLESFRLRARAWIRENLAPVSPPSGPTREDDEAELAELERQRGIQRMLFDAGFAGMVVPKQYGGAGLTPAHNRVFNEEIAGHDYPSMLQIATMTPVLPVIVEFGSEEQKLRHVPLILKGERIFAQFLSEPGGGSDAAGAITTAVRDGEEWVLNGSKIWSSGGWRCDWAITLVRTNWDVEKHRGLTVFLLPTKAPGLEIHRIEMLNGSSHFCQEFFTDVRMSDADRIGEIDAGWTVGVRWMFFERSLYASPFVTWPAASSAVPGTGSVDDDLVRIARRSGRINNSIARDLIGEVRANTLVTSEAQQRIYQGVRTGYLSDQGAALVRLLRGYTGTRHSTVAFDLAGDAGYAWTELDALLGRAGIESLSKQAGQIGGGTSEMARNVVSERVLGMPRERTGDRDVPYREVPKGPPSR